MYNVAKKSVLSVTIHFYYIPLDSSSVLLNLFVLTYYQQYPLYKVTKTEQKAVCVHSSLDQCELQVPVHHICIAYTYLKNSIKCSPS
jgi:hypothetical protein